MDIQTARAAMDSVLARRVVKLCLSTSYQALVGCCAIGVFSFIFSSLSVMIVHVGVADVVVDAERVMFRLTHRKSKPTSRPLLLS